MARRILSQYKRGEVLIGSIVEEDRGARTAMFIELQINTKHRQEVLKFDIPEMDQDLAEMRLSQEMSKIFHELHGKVSKI